MKLKMIALCSIAAACAGTAQAQSNVILYGVIDTGIEYVNNQPGGGHDLVRMTPANLAASRWGLRGTEDLGNGLKGVFVLESGFESDTGKSTQGGRLFGRSAYVGLDGRWGVVTLGRQTTPFYWISGTIDPMLIATKYSILAQDAAFAGRADNAIKYVGKFGPMETQLFYSFGADSTVTGGSEIPGSAKIGREYSGSAAYNGANWSVAAAYDEINTGTVSARPDATTRRATVGGNFAIGNATLYAGYRWAKAFDGALLAGAPATANQRSNLWWAGARWQATSNVTLAGAAYYQDFAGTSADPWMFVASGAYAFSKRTSAYLAVGYTKNRNGSNLGLGTGGSGFGTVSAGDNQFGASVALRHIF